VGDFCPGIWVRASMHWCILLLYFPFSLLKSLDIWFHLIIWCHVVAGVYLAERLNRVMGDYWRSFASQNYFDPHGLFLSVLWSGPLLIIATIILVGVCSYPFNLLLFSFFLLFILTLLSYLQINSLFSLCYMIVRWKRAELRHRARLARESNKQDWSSLACWSVRKIEEPLLPLRQFCSYKLYWEYVFFLYPTKSFFSPLLQLRMV
jgi:hypothetical protein